MAMSRGREIGMEHGVTVQEQDERSAGLAPARIAAERGRGSRGLDGDHLRAALAGQSRAVPSVEAESA